MVHREPVRKPNTCWSLRVEVLFVILTIVASQALARAHGSGFRANLGLSRFGCGSGFGLSGFSSLVWGSWVPVAAINGGRNALTKGRNTVL